MQLNYSKLGEYIELVSHRNTDHHYGESDVRGVSNNKEIIPTKANNKSRAFNNFYVVSPNDFIYNSRTSRMGEKVGFGFNDTEKTIITSFNNTVFKVKNELLLPRYLFMWFKRPEFDRYARFHSWGSSTEIFSWSEMCSVELPVPSIQKQQEIVKEYSAVVNRIKLNAQLNKKLGETAQALYKNWFVDFEFPNKNGQPYKSSGGKMVHNKELDQDIPDGFSSFYLGDKLDLIKSPIRKKDINEETKYVPIDCLPKKHLFIKKYRNSNEANSSLILFKEKDILIGAMRVYFHRVCLSHFDGVTRGTTFVLRSRNVSDLFFLLILCNQESTISYANSASKGTTMPYAVWENEFEKLRILFPTDRLLFLFNQLIDPILKTILNHSKEEENLKRISHLLLSKISKDETFQTSHLKDQ
tara:strand:+ start:1656 stop:2894 length:1239 start_codon:yes stop_codon:yes gene_type:complete